MTHESIVQFGPHDRLCGILGGAWADAPIVVLPNSGVVPRAGLFRLHVELARALDVVGLRSFRFDLPGIGEAPRIAGMDHRTATLAAIDHLDRFHGGRRFVLGGVCSAADLAWRVAVTEPRIVGLILLDPVSYPRWAFQFARIAALARRPPAQWIGVAARLLGRLRAPGSVQTAADFRDWPTREQARADLAALHQRGVRSLWIYTGGVSDRFRHRREFTFAFGRQARNPLLRFEHWPECDHTFYLRAHRDRLIDCIRDWAVGVARDAAERLQ